MRKLINIAIFFLTPFISLCQATWIYDAIADKVKSDFYKCNLKENICKFDTVKIYGYNISSSGTDSSCIAIIPIDKKVLCEDNIIPSTDSTYSSFFGRLACKKTYYSNNKVESIIAFFENKPIQIVKYKYHKSDTVLITKYNNVNVPNEWKIEEQIIFNPLKKETRYYFYKTGISTERFIFLKKDNLNRIIYEERCLDNYSDKIKYKHTTDSLLIECESNPENLRIITEKYSYNKNGLFDTKISRMQYNGKFWDNGYYDYLKYYYK